MAAHRVTKQDNPARFEISIADDVAGFVRFVDEAGQRIFFHTEISDRFGGQGLAGEVVQQALEETRDEGLRIVPVCPFVTKVVDETEEFDDILDKATPKILEIVDRVRS